MATSSTTDYQEILRHRLIRCGYRFENGFAISPSGSKTKISSSFDLQDLLESEGVVSDVDSSSLSSEQDIYQQYGEDFGEDLVDLVQRTVKHEYSRGRSRLVTRQDSEDFGSDLVKLVRRGAQEVLRGRKLISEQDIDDFGDDLVEMVRHIAKDEFKVAKDSNDESLPSKVITNPPLTTLHKSPFFVIGASIRDDRRSIIELADEKSLTHDSVECAKARSDLTTPRNRLLMEMGWLPGLSPNSAKVLVSHLQNHVDMIKRSTAAPALAKANLIAAACEILDPEMSAETWCDWIVEFANTVEMIDPEDVLRDINEDRIVSGFPEIRSLDQIESELHDRKRYYAEVLKSTLDRFSSMRLVSVVTNVVEHTTASGEEHAPQLIHELVDRYQTEAERFLIPEAENIEKLIETIRSSAKQGQAAIRPMVEKLDQLARKWDSIAQPIQLSMKAQGLDHELSHQIAWSMRSLAIDLFNKHDMLDVAKRLNATLQELFAELPAVVERLEEDSDALADIQKKREKSKADKERWEREITYSAEIGLVFKDQLGISPRGVSWKGTTISLDDVTRVRWGAVSKSVNGIPSGTFYTMAVGDRHRELVAETIKKDIFDSFTDRLWKAVCVRLIDDQLNHLKNGNRLTFGNTTIDDEGVFLKKSGFFSGDPRYYKWSDVRQFSSNGSLYIVNKADEKVFAALSYLEIANTHILEPILRLSFKKWRGRLSGLLED